VGATEPPRSKSGIKIMSMSMLMGHEPVVWRESMLAGAFRQLYRDVQWGELDYLLVDAPGGTSDVSMAILESLPLTGTIIVASPQRVANTTVKKCITMVQQYKQSVLGVVENMSYYVAPSGVRCELFGPSSSEVLATLAGAPLLAQLPVERELAALCDAGQIEACRAELYEAFVARFLLQKVIAGHEPSFQSGGLQESRNADL
jgi:Mrp family chromosome partitioning ATPase